MNASFNPKKLTQARGELSLEAIAAAAGVSANTIRNWESGQHEPSASALKAIVDLTGKPFDFFFRAA